MTTIDQTADVALFASTASREGSRTIVELHGEVDMTVAPALRGSLEALIGTGNVDLVLDLAALDFIDSSGLSVLVAMHRVAVVAGGGIRLRSPRPSTRRVLETTRLADLLPIEDAPAAP